MTVHLIRETAFQAGHAHVRPACQPVALRLPRDGRMGDVATGWASLVTCEGCADRPGPWEPWKRNAAGFVPDLGRIIPV
jgi:hypothetical protein